MDLTGIGLRSSAQQIEMPFSWTLRKLKFKIEVSKGRLKFQRGKLKVKNMAKKVK